MMSSTKHTRSEPKTAAKQFATNDSFNVVDATCRKQSYEKKDEDTLIMVITARLTQQIAIYYIIINVSV